MVIRQYDLMRDNLDECKRRYRRDRKLLYETEIMTVDDALKDVKKKDKSIRETSKALDGPQGKKVLEDNVNARRNTLERWIHRVNPIFQRLKMTTIEVSISCHYIEFNGYVALCFMFVIVVLAVDLFASSSSEPTYPNSCYETLIDSSQL